MNARPNVVLIEPLRDARGPEVAHPPMSEGFWYLCEHPERPPRADGWYDGAAIGDGCRACTIALLARCMNGRLTGLQRDVFVWARALYADDPPLVSMLNRALASSDSELRGEEP